jgi:hypothetical protein
MLPLWAYWQIIGRTEASMKGPSGRRANALETHWAPARASRVE